METKGGSIQAMHLYDLTGLRAQDLVVGDSNGVVTMFSRQRFLSKLDVGSPATHICIHEMEGKVIRVIYPMLGNLSLHSTGIRDYRWKHEWSSDEFSST